MSKSSTRKFGIHSLSISSKLVLAVLVVLLLTMSVFTVVVTSSMTRALDAQALNQLQTQTDLVRDMVETYDESLRARIDDLEEIFISRFPDGLSLDPNIRIAIGDVSTPLLSSGDSTLNLNFHLIDRFTRVTGAIATVFARDGDDFVRVTTSLKKQNGDRAIGTYLGKKHPGYEGFMNKKPYLGVAKLFGRDYMTKYVPVVDKQGNVIGIFFVGVDFTDGLKVLRDKIKALKIGKTGYFFVLDNRPGKSKGTLVVHPAKEGSNILNTKDSSGREFVREMIEKRNGVIRYPWINKELGETEPRDKVVTYVDYAPWHWTIAAGSYMEEFRAESVTLRNYMIIATTIAVAILVLLVSYLVSRLIKKPLVHAVSMANEIADGNLAVRSNEQRGDEMGQLLDAMDNISKRVSGVMIGVMETTAILLNVSEQVSSSAQNLSSGASQQAASIEETSASLEEMNSTIHQNSDNARTTDDIANKAAKQAEEGGSAVTETVSAMSNIADKISIIEDIAYKTNLLALNAAIEAARAGEHGKGFAVVADEVRKLAERSQTAAQEISQQAGQSVSIATRAGELLNQMLPSIQHTAELIREISAASDEQSNGVDQVNRAIEQLDQVAQQAAASSEELASTSVQMSDNVHSLQKQIAYFTLR